MRGLAIWAALLAAIPSPVRADYLVGVGPVVLVDDIRNSQDCKVHSADVKESVEFPIATSRLKILDKPDPQTTFQVLVVEVELMAVTMGDGTQYKRNVGCVSRIEMSLGYMNLDGSQVILWARSLLSINHKDELSKSVRSQVDRLTKSLVIDWSKANPQ
jgi:hypothetical protein